MLSTTPDFTQNGQRYDLILAVNGYYPISAFKRVLAPNGTYVMAGGTAAQMAQAVRDLCGALGYHKMQLRFLARGERLVALEQAGWRVVRHTDPIYLFARPINRV